MQSKNLEGAIETGRMALKNSFGDEPVIVIKVCGTIEWSKPDRIVEKDGCLICFDAYDKLKVANEQQHYVAGVLAGIRIGSGLDYSFKRIGEGSYLTMPDGKILHSFSARLGTGRIYVSSRLNPEQFATVSSSIGAILGRKAFHRITQLHRHSIEETTDEVVAFLSAWSALEQFVNKVFPEYQVKLRRAIDEMAGNAAQIEYLRHLEGIAEGKQKVTDKFTLILAFLAENTDGEGNGFERDLRIFKRLKKNRDELAHGSEMTVERTTTYETQKLFDEYFRRHLRNAM